MSLWIPKPGDKVVIPKGVPVRSTYPRRKEKKAGRTYEVKVHTTRGPGGALGGLPGVIEVVWVGSSGYWHWCALHHVRPVKRKRFRPRAGACAVKKHREVVRTENLRTGGKGWMWLLEESQVWVEEVCPPGTRHQRLSLLWSVGPDLVAYHPADDFDEGPSALELLAGVEP